MLRQHETYTMRGAGATKKLFAALFIALLTLAASAMPASAVVSDPPGFPYNLTVFPERDFIEIDFAPNTPVVAEVVRNGVVIGSAVGTTGPKDPALSTPTKDVGVLEVNHPGGVCWRGSTPNIIPGDVIRVVEDANGNGVADAVEDNGIKTTTRDVIVTDAAAKTNPTTVVMKGTAPAGVTAADMESRIVQPDLVPIIGKRDVRAPGGPLNNAQADYTGTLNFAPGADPGTQNWTATFAFTGPQAGAAADAAVAGQSRALSWSVDPATAERVGITIFEFGEVGGPGFGGCPAPADYAVTSSDPGIINNATNGQDLKVSGVSQNASAVSVNLDDQDATTQAVTADATTAPVAGDTQGNQTWSATFTAAQVGGLKDGTLTATGTYTVNGTPLNGVNLKIKKDTAVPAAPTASPPAGRYTSAQSVTLNESDADPAAKIHYTIGTTPPDPNANDREFTGQIQVTASQTIKAVVVDGAGNVSPVATFAYTIGAATAPAAPTIGTATAGNASATVPWTAPNNGGSAITRYEVQVRNAATGTNVGTPRTASASPANITGLTNGTGYQFRVRAVNAVGTGPYSAFSNTVTPTTGTQPPPVGGLPGAPTIGTAVNGVAGGTVSATARWSPPANNGGSAITGYLVTAVRVNASGAPHSTGQTATMTAGANATSKEMTTANLNSGTLVSGAFYKFKVQASNTPGTGAKTYGTASALSNQVTAQ